MAAPSVDALGEVFSAVTDLRSVKMLCIVARGISFPGISRVRLIGQSFPFSNPL